MYQCVAGCASVYQRYSKYQRVLRSVQARTNVHDDVYQRPRHSVVIRRCQNTNTLGFEKPKNDVDSYVITFQNGSVGDSTPQKEGEGVILSRDDDNDDALWSRTTKNPDTDLSAGPLAHLFPRSLEPLIHSLAPECSLCSHAPLRSFICSLAHSLPSLRESE